MISLSDLHTPWPAIERRVRAAAEGDYVTVFYNPRSRGRGWQLGRALEILAEHRPPGTPVGCVRNASRPDERSWISELGAFDPAGVDMYTVVLVGSSQSRTAAGRMVTPRGYTWHQPSSEAAEAAEVSEVAETPDAGEPGEPGEGGRP